MSGKVPEYTQRAIKKYREKFDRVTVSLEKGTKDRIKQVSDLSVSGFISELVYRELERLESGDPSVASPVAHVYDDIDDLPFA